jgi:hypothetical protein
MSEYEKLLRDYIKMADISKTITNQQTKNFLIEFLDTYFADVICEYSTNNKMSLEEIIGCQIATGFCYYRKFDFKELLNEFLDEF